MPLSQAFRDLVLNDYVHRYPSKRAALIPALWAAQNELGWVPSEAMEEIGEMLDVAPMDVYAVASFYSMFHLRPVGKYLIEVCQSPACWVNGATETLHRLCERLEIGDSGGHGGGTTADGQYTVRFAECLAACDRAPAVQVNLRYHGPVRAEDVDRFLEHTQAFNLEEPMPPVPGQSGPAGMAVEPAAPGASASPASPTVKESSPS
jgi:NADH-quinone oxidoreductase subunit E